MKKIQVTVVATCTVPEDAVFQTDIHGNNIGFDHNGKHYSFWLTAEQDGERDLNRDEMDAVGISIEEYDEHFIVLNPKITYAEFQALQRKGN